MGAPAGLSSTTITDKRFLLTGQLTLEAGSALMAGGQVSDLTRTHEHPPGTVLAKRTSTGKFVRADDANADAQAAASVATLITNPGSGGWDGNLVIKGHWGTLTVALSGANTDAAVAAAIIAAAAALNPESQAPITAADTTGEVTIYNVDKGRGTWLHAKHATVAAMLGANGTGANGTDPDIRVTRTTAWLKDVDGVAQDYHVDTIRAGDFDTSELSGLTAEARAVLENNGSRFD